MAPYVDVFRNDEAGESDDSEEDAWETESGESAGSSSDWETESDNSVGSVD